MPFLSWKEGAGWPDFMSQSPSAVPQRSRSNDDRSEQLNLNNFPSVPLRLFMFASCCLLMPWLPCLITSAKVRPVKPQLSQNKSTSADGAPRQSGVQLEALGFHVGESITGRDMVSLDSQLKALFCASFTVCQTTAPQSRVRIVRLQVDSPERTVHLLTA